MPADATTILAAVKTALGAAFADVPVYVSKRRATDGKNKESGWQAGFKTPCFVVSCSEPEEIDRRGTFAHVTVGYPVAVEYVKLASAKVDNAPNEGAPTVVEDPGIRDVRASLRAALYKPYLIPGTTRDVAHRTFKPYEKGADGGAVLVVSGEQFTYMTTEPRPSPR